MIAATKQLNVLVVEDDFMNSRFLTIVLKRLGYKSDIAEDGIEAIHKYKSNKYDLILMDIDMPLMNGLQASEKVREIEREKGIINGIKIIAVTAKAVEGEKEKCFDHVPPEWGVFSGSGPGHYPVRMCPPGPDQHAGTKCVRPPG